MKEYDDDYHKSFAEAKASHGKSLESSMGLDQTQVHLISREMPERGKRKDGDTDFNNSFQQSVSSLNRWRRLFLKALHFVPDL